MSKGRFGAHGGQYIPETLMNAVIELEEAYYFYKGEAEFQRELTDLLNEYAGRPSRLYFAKQFVNNIIMLNDFFSKLQIMLHKCVYAIGYHFDCSPSHIGNMHFVYAG